MSFESGVILSDGNTQALALVLTGNSRKFFKEGWTFPEAVDEKLADERLVIVDGAGDQPAFRAQIGFVSIQNVRQG